MVRAASAILLQRPDWWRVLAILTCTVAIAGCATSKVAINPVDPDPAAATATDIASLTTVIQQNPGDPVAYNVRGTAFGKAGQLKEAKADFDQAIGLKPDFYQAYANRALVERDMKRDDLAFNDYNTALAINPNYAVANVGRGNMYRLRMQYDLALADFNRAISLDGNDPRAYHNRGLVYQARDQHDPAIDDFSKAIQIASGNSEPFFARGVSHLALGDAMAALDDFNVVVTRDRSSYAGWTYQGLALERLGDLMAAHQAFAYAASLNPQHQPAVEGAKRTAAFATEKTTASAAAG